LDRCPHGLIPTQCTYCRAREPSPPPDLRLFAYTPHNTEARTFGLTLDRQIDGNSVSVFLHNGFPEYSGDVYRVIAESEIDFRFADFLELDGQRSYRSKLREFALQQGLLFDPTGPLTWREQAQLGPSRCSHCQQIVSFARHSLGCRQCNYYVCPDGYCLCGEGWLTNYLGRVFPPQSPLPIPFNVRRAATRIATHITPAGIITGG
jgi:hypothetical protein